MLVDQVSNIKAIKVFDPQVPTGNTAIVGAIISHIGFGSVTYLIQLGTLADADATFAVTLEHGDDSGLSDTAAVVNGQLIGTLAGVSYQYDDDNKVCKLGYIGGKNYSRLTVTGSNNTGNHPVSCLCVLGHPRKAPLSTQKV